MKIVFIGAGNLATHLSAALRAGGHDIVQIYSRTMTSASALAARVGAEPTDSIDSVCRDADVYIFAVKDDVLPQLATQLGGKCGDAVMLHTAGSVSMDVFRDVAHRYGVLYPMQSFSKTRHLELRDVPVYIEANCDEALAVARTLADSVSVKVRELSGQQFRELLLRSRLRCCRGCWRAVHRLPATHRRDGGEGARTLAPRRPDRSCRALRPQRDGAPDGAARGRRGRA